MQQQSAIIVFLLVVIGVLFINELRRQHRERIADTIYDTEKANAIMKTLDLQADFIESLNGRVESLGKVVEAVVKILESEQKQKDQEKDGQISTIIKG